MNYPISPPSFEKPLVSEASSSFPSSPVSEDEKNHVSWKRFQEVIESPTPALLIDSTGNLLHLTPLARRLLKYQDDQPVDDYFFSHIHGSCLHRVMSDVAHMVRYGKEKASWMLCLRTGTGRWSWYKATAYNKLKEASVILIHLRDLYRW